MGRVGRWLMITVVIAAPGMRPAYADIYSFRDDSGTTHLTNVPSDARYELAIQEPAPPDPLKKGSGIQRYGQLVEQVAREHDIDPALLNAVITVESAFNPNAISHKGAVGLMQLMPATARRYGVANRYDPAENVRGGAGYLRDLMELFDGNIPLALAAYNAGEKAVARNGNRIPPNRETPTYVMRVMELYKNNQPDYR